jgi:hypothetical protein
VKGSLKRLKTGHIAPVSGTAKHLHIGNGRLLRVIIDIASRPGQCSLYPAMRTSEMHTSASAKGRTSDKVRRREESRYLITSSAVASNATTSEQRIKPAFLNLT